MHARGGLRSGRPTISRSRHPVGEGFIPPGPLLVIAYLPVQSVGAAYMPPAPPGQYPLTLPPPRRSRACPARTLPQAAVPTPATRAPTNHPGHINFPPARGCDLRLPFSTVLTAQGWMLAPPLLASLVKGRWRRSAGGIPACCRLLSFNHPGRGRACPARTLP